MNYKLQLPILLLRVKARARLLPFPRVTAPNVPVSHYHGIRVTFPQHHEKLPQRGLLRVRPVIHKVHAARVRHVYACGVISLHAVTHPALGKQLVYNAVSCHHVMIPGVLPAIPPELRQQPVNGCLLAPSRAVHEYPFNLPHLFLFYVKQSFSLYFLSQL